MRQLLDKLFRPRRIAVIGASDRAGSAGQVVFANVLAGGFKGDIFPVNLRHESVQGREAYRHIGHIPRQVDLALVCTPVRTWGTVARECGEAGVDAMVIFPPEQQEMTAEDKAQFGAINDLCRRYGMRLLGPGSLGLMSPWMGINATTAGAMAQPGSIAFISQSNALGAAVLDWAIHRKVGLSYFAAPGAMTDVGFEDLIDYFGTAPHISCIIFYMEELNDARRFMSAARAFARSKPIIGLKAGRVAESETIRALSRTGLLMASDAAFDAAFRRAGIIRVDTVMQLFSCAQTLAMQDRPAGNRLTIITPAEGPGLLAADFLKRNGGRLATLSPTTRRQIKKSIETVVKPGNPLKLPANITPEQYEEAILTCLQDEQTDGLLAIMTPQADPPPEALAHALVRAARDTSKTVLASWIGEGKVWAARHILEEGQVPHFRFPETAVDTFLKMYDYACNLELLKETPPLLPETFEPDKAGVHQLIDRVRSEGRRQLTEPEAREMMQYYGILSATPQVAANAAQAADIAEKTGYPVVLKVVSPDIRHKTAAGGVRLGLHNARDVRKAFQNILETVPQHRPDAAIRGILVERMIDMPFQLIIGAKKDPIFGPLILFGHGGAMVEAIRDIAIGLPPLNLALARRIIENTRIYPLLQGVEGHSGANIEHLAILLCRFAYLVMDFPEIREIDLNPYMADESGGAVVDAHIILEPPNGKPASPYAHLVISPYPAQYTRRITLRDGQAALLRPIRPEDEPLEYQMFEYLSKQTLYFRFFGYIPQVTHDFLARFTQIDYDREMAIIAEIDDFGEKKMIGVVRIVADPWKESAEYAIVVADPWQNQGLGSQLTSFILDIARDMGLRRITASVLERNEAMLQLFRRFGFRIRQEDFRTYAAELDL